jgi:hypothetical protein
MKYLDTTDQLHQMTSELDVFRLALVECLLVRCCCKVKCREKVPQPKTEAVLSIELSTCQMLVFAPQMMETKTTMK